MGKILKETRKEGSGSAARHETRDHPQYPSREAHIAVWLA